MQEKTKADYRKLAEHFYRSRLPGQPPSPKRICDALAACAHEYRPDYWVRLRGALAYDQERRGYHEAAERIRQMKNPVREKGLPIKPKQARVKTISEADEAKLLQGLVKADDAPVLAAYYIAKFSGIRPAEMWDLRIQGDRLVVTGAKKSHGGQRGADREIVIDPAIMSMMPTYLRALRKHKDESIAPIQRRLRYICSKVWPRRKALPTLYTWRHQMGSNLRAAGRDRVEVAYIMGHQSTKSVDQYGDKRTAKAGAALPRVPDGTDLGRIRVKHRGAPPAPPAPAYDFGF